MGDTPRISAHGRQAERPCYKCRRLALSESTKACCPAGKHAGSNERAVAYRRFQRFAFEHQSRLKTAACIRQPSQILPYPLEHGMPHLTLSRFRPVLNLRQQRRFNPNAAMSDALAVRLRLPDQRLETRLQFFGAVLVEAMIDLAGIDQLVALAPTQIQAVPFGAVECEAGNGQRLALSAGFLHPIIRPSGWVFAVPHL